MNVDMAALAGGETMLRRLDPHWNAGMIAASIAISFLGAFTSTQLSVSSVDMYSLHHGRC